MMNTELVLDRLKLAIEQSEELQRGLRQRQEDLLSLEKEVRKVVAGRTSGLVVIDQAEDIRRTVNIHAIEQLAEIRVALIRANGVLDAAVSEQGVPTEVARKVGHLVNAAGEETRRVTNDLYGVDQALSRTSQAAPDDRRLAALAQGSIDRAAGRLESARRATFRIVEDLPVIARGIRGMPAADRSVVQLDMPTGSAVTERRRTAPSESMRAAGPAPRW